MRAYEVIEMTPADKFIAKASEFDTSHVSFEIQKDLTYGDESVVYIAGIYAKDSGKGYGTKMMRLLIDLADRYEITLSLVLSRGEGDYTRDDLQKYYTRFGFEGRGLSMTRKPR